MNRIADTIYQVFNIEVVYQHAVDVQLEYARRVDLRLTPGRLGIARRGGAGVPYGERVVAQQFRLFAAHAVSRVVTAAGSGGLRCVAT